MKRLRLITSVLSGGILLSVALAYATNRTPKLGDFLEYQGTAGADQPATHHDHQEKSDDHNDHGADDQPGNHETQTPQGSANTGRSESHDEENGQIKMTAEDINVAKIELQPAGAGRIAKRLRLPGTIIADRSRVGRVASKVVGTVIELKKGLGDSVKADEIIAILDSREVAEAKSEFIAATVNYKLQDTLYQREKTLWEKQVTAEQRLLRAQATFQEAQVRRDVALQKLFALGVGEDVVAKLADPGQPATGLQRYEIKAPINGRIVEQMVDIGTPMGGEGQAHELYAIADLSKIWVELTVSAQHLAQIEEGQSLTIEASGMERRSQGTIILISPILNQDTRSARVTAAVDNSDGVWRPGSFVTADVALTESQAAIVLPKSALQTLKGETHVFVRTETGFEARRVELGSDDGNSVEILSGLGHGDHVATANSFLLKAELGKAEAEHVH